MTGTVTAATEKEAKTLLADQNLQILILKESASATTASLHFFKKGFPTNEKISLCRNLAVMVKAGLSLEEAFELFAKSAANQTVREVFQSIGMTLRKGEPLTKGFSQYPRFFDEVFLSMIKAGESSGTLEQSFAYMGQQLKQEEDLRRKTINALLYPLIVICLMMGIGVLMMTFVLPRLGRVFLTLNLELPFLTKTLLQVSLFLEKNIPLLIVSLLGSASAVVIAVTSRQGKKILYSLAVRLPVVKNLMLYYNLARFNQSLSVLLKGGVAVGESLAIASGVLALTNKGKLAASFNEKVSRGQPLADVFAEEPTFPSLMARMVAVGEKTGKLEDILLDVAVFYQEEVENSLKNFVALLEPLLMIAVGIGVGIMILAFISPIYSLIGKLQPGV